ncbi:tetratricopeptide repeat protein [Nocardioides marmorisolisilvae]|uniref:Tetratricopeptide repeat protein n=1 Tax=Nocardioides marmorisolisilvae TaxID=1542737 RepID=A0A3N0DUS9_9ACTN|nr:hypothetical protein [Nocardioides marmorisolisilvae]RNL79163.1 hypothetical protein EFL95_09035 [Nocardioides marmorisolisilvae]
MTDGPWANEAERRLMIRAVAKMSDTCEMPDLTPDCPFFEIGSSGPECAEQCRDLMERYPEDHASASTGHDLGHASLDAVQRRRPRRAPRTAEVHAFDARRRLLSDIGKPLSEWTFTSILMVLKDRAVALGSEGHGANVAVSDLLDAITDRGMNPDAIIPAAFALPRAARVAVAILADKELAAIDASELSKSFKKLIASGKAWAPVLRDFLGHPEDSDPATIVTDPRTVSTLTNWFRSRGAAGIFSDDVPSLEELRLVEDLPAISKVALHDARWMLDRFTETYADGWAYDSLLSEYRYLLSNRAGCAPSAIMKENHHEAAKIAEMIAVKASDGASSAQEDSSTVNVSLFTAVAVQRLNAGKRAEAAAVYRALAQVKPDDAEVLNNLGFCQIIDNPPDAIRALKRSATLSPATGLGTVTLLNLALAHHRVGENADAQRYLAEVYERPDLGDSAFMWAVDDGEPRVELVVLAEYASALTTHIDECVAGCRERQSIALTADVVWLPRAKEGNRAIDENETDEGGEKHG